MAQGNPLGTGSLIKSQVHPPLPPPNPQVDDSQSDPGLFSPMDVDNDTIGDFASNCTVHIELTSSDFSETPMEDAPHDPEQYSFNPLHGNYLERSDHDAAATFGSQVENRWQEYRARMHFDSKNPFAPWKSIEEFQLVEWLISSKLSQGAIDLFLQLPIVSSLCLGIL